jgi:phosphate transport system substrate-binding protein
MFRKLSVLVAVLVFAVMILSACAPAAAPTAEAPAPEAEAPAAESEAPVAEAEAPAAEVEALSGTLTLAGSTTVQPLAEKAGEAFMDANPDVTIEVQGGGSSVGVTAAADGTANIGNISREVKEEELTANPDFQVFTVAKDGIAIVVNPDVALQNLTKDQVRDIFSGKVTNFKEVGGPDAPITVVSREEGSGTRSAFQELVMQYKDASGNKAEDEIVASAILQNSNGALRTTVAETPNSIAFLSFGYLDDSVATVNIEGVEATVENVLNSTYPISRPLNMITNGDPIPLAKAFIDFLLSDEGQAIAVEEGFITIK